jgi:imidazolonepropionase-like amidohydrolase
MRITLLLILWFAGCLSAADIALVGGTVYPSPDAPAITNAVIVIHAGRITAVGPHESVKVPRNFKVIDCSGRFVTAGFWNSHVHVLTPVLLDAHSASAGGLNQELDRMVNRWGFTTVFDIGSVLENTAQLRRRVESGEVRGPRILTTGEPLWTQVPIYTRDYLAEHKISIPTATTPDAAARVREQVQRGANGVKLFTGSMQGEGKVANMPLNMVRAAADEAHRLRIPVFAHPQNSEGLEAAIAGGVDILAHTAPQSPPWDAAFVARLKSAHMALIPTLTLFDFEGRKAGLSDAERTGWIDQMIGQLRAFSQAGGEVLFGTDIGYIDHYDTGLEFTLMARAGMNFRQILASLTTNPAHRFGYSTHSGRIKKGMDADLTVLEGDPARDVTALSRILLTIRSGEVIYSAN